MDRRCFLGSLLAAGALAGLGRRLPAEAGRRISLGIRLDSETPEGWGAGLGVEEARRLGELLHVGIEASRDSGFALIGLAAPAEETGALFLEAGAPAEPVVRPAWNVASSAAFRRQALARHPDRRDLRAVDWHPGLDKFGAQDLNVRFLRRFGQAMDGRAWHGWIAVKCAVEIALRYPGGSPRERVAELRLDGHKGMMLRFDPEDRHLVQPVYLVDGAGRLVEAVEPEGGE